VTYEAVWGRIPRLFRGRRIIVDSR
jgi:hypothetical protein